MTPRLPELKGVMWQPPSATRLVAGVLKHRRLIIVSTLTLVVGGVLTILALGPQYEVSAALFFKLGREMTPPATAAKGPIVAAGKRPEDISSEIEIMKSRALLERVVAHFGEDFFFASPPPTTLLQRVKAVAKRSLEAVKDSVREVFIFTGLARRLTPSEQVVLALERGLRIEVAPRSDVVNIRLRFPDPHIGEQIVAKFIEGFLEQHIAAHKTPKAREFFEQQSALFRKKLANAEAARARFKQSHTIWSLDEQRKLLLSEQRQIAAAREGTLAEVAQIETEVTGQERQLAELPAELRVSSVTQRNAIIDVLRTRLLELEAKRESLRGRYTEQSRPMVALHHEIEEVRRSLAAQEPTVTQSETSGLNAVRQDLERALLTRKGSLSGLRTKVAKLEAQLRGIEAELVKVDAAEVELRRLDREIPLLEQSYSLYAKSLEDARISEAMDLVEISNVSVVSPPAASPVPVFPPRPALLLVVITIVGLTASVAVALVLEALRPTVHSREDVAEIMNVPVLATIPEMKVNGRSG
jgi:succinoglycan biosynthesis transport protein ExoP